MQTIDETRLAHLRKLLGREPTEWEIRVFNSECNKLSRITGLKF